jgi:hypothetical protein
LLNVFTACLATSKFHSIFELADDSYATDKCDIMLNS